MHWEKQGHLYTPPSKDEYLVSHAANPLAVYLDDDVYRVFYSGRNADNKSSVGCVDIDIVSKSVVQEHNKVVFPVGQPDDFYSHGVSIGNCYGQDGQDFILFMAWKIENENSHWYGTVGRLALNDKRTLDVTPNAPFMALDDEDPVSLSYPWVINEDGLYKMWYGSTIDWKATTNEEMIHVLKYATSKDGVNWDKHGIAVPYEENIAQAFSRPTVIQLNGEYHMWYSYRSGTGQTYRIGHAISADGMNWQRHELQGCVDVSADGWDSDMVCYPYVLEHKDEVYMLYNGNGFGKTGFGLTKLQK